MIYIIENLIRKKGKAESRKITHHKKRLIWSLSLLLFLLLSFHWHCPRLFLTSSKYPNSSIWLQCLQGQQCDQYDWSEKDPDQCVFQNRTTGKTQLFEKEQFSEIRFKPFSCDQIKEGYYANFTKRLLSSKFGAYVWTNSFQPFPRIQSLKFQGPSFCTKRLQWGHCVKFHYFHAWDCSAIRRCSNMISLVFRFS